MEKRYQVFVSSTYADLKEERQRVIQALMELDCIPAGMELFPATDQEQFEFIKKIIDDCDYYLLIVGGRYGSLTEAGVSYTEREFDYAVSKGMKVIAFLHANPDVIPLGQSEKVPELREKLNAFCEKVKTNRLVKFWTKADELPGLVALSVSKTIKTFPAAGWVRGNTAANATVLNEINELRKQNNELQQQIAMQAPQSPSITNLAGLDENFGLRGRYQSGSGARDWERAVSWRDIFAAISPYLTSHENSASVKNKLAEYAFEKTAEKIRGGYSPSLNDQIFQTVAVQMRALGLVTITSLQTTQGGMADFWRLTANGEQLMLQLRSVKSATLG